MLVNGMKKLISALASCLVLITPLYGRVTTPYDKVQTLGEYRAKYVGKRAVIMVCEGLHFAK
jgi:hypothetical protein